MALIPNRLDDALLVQEMFVTKTTLLLARDATAEEWRFEHRKQVEAAGDLWADGHAFLFDYTLGRLAAATKRIGMSTGAFAEYFTLAIKTGAPNAALNIWSAERSVPTQDPDSLTVALLANLLDPLEQDERMRLVTALPPPFTQCTRARSRDWSSHSPLQS